MDLNPGQDAIHKFVTAIRSGETRRDALEPLVREELAALEAQHQPRQLSMWSHYDPRSRAPDEGVVAVFAALAGDEPLWRRLVEHLVSADFAARKEQKWSGVDPEDLGPVPTMHICAERLRWHTNRILEDAPQAKRTAAPVLDRWHEAVAAEDRAARQKRDEGQQIQDPPPRIRSENVWSKYPDLAAEHRRIHEELERRGAVIRSGNTAAWLFYRHPDLAEARDRLDDELDRREGVVRPVIRVKVGDTVVAAGKRWKVTSVNARLNVADLEWREGTTSYSIPATADQLVPES